jgi:hypothetical protein
MIWARGCARMSRHGIVGKHLPADENILYFMPLR